MDHLEVHFTGESARASAEAFSSLFRELFDAEPKELPSGKIQTSEPTRSVDPLAAAAVVLALPGAVLATMDLAQRLQLGEQLARFKTRLADETRHHQTRTRLVNWNGLVYDFDKLEPHELIDILGAQE
jgi:hypothetical protein